MFKIAGESVTATRGTDEFALYLASIKGQSSATVRAYLNDVAAFASYLNVAPIPAQLADGLTKARVGLYLMERMSERRRGQSGPAQLTARSAARMLSALQAYAQYLIYTGVANANPLVGFKPPKYSRKLPEYFNLDELKALLGAFDDSENPLHLRNAAMLHVLYGCGLRVAECVSLDIQALKLDEGWLSVTGKGNKQRNVPFGQPVALPVLRWLELGRPKLVTGESRQALWLNNRGGRLSDRAVRNVVNQASLRAGQLKHLSPHKLRHACATHMLEGGADVRLVQDLLGHASLSTTQVYTQVTRRQLLEVYEKTHPRAERDE